MTMTPKAILGRHARAIRILTCLQSGPGFNADELSRHLGVSKRTIYRDLNLIREAGVAIRFDAHQSAYRLERDSQQHLLPSFSGDDLMQLVVAAHTSWINASPEAQSRTRDAINKLLCLHPSSVRNEVTQMLGGCFSRLSEHDFSDEDWRAAVTILQSIGQRRRARAVVIESGRPAVTTLTPYRLDVYPHRWTVTGRSSRHGDRVTLDIQCLQEVVITNEPFEPPRAARFLEEESVLEMPRPTEIGQSLSRSGQAPPPAAPQWTRRGIV